MNDTITQDYNSIEVLNGLAGIRKKLGMYLGSTSSIDGKKMPKALMQAIQELLSNALDEAAIKNDKSNIYLTIDSDNNLIEIKDAGRGMPKGPKDSFSEVINAATKPHSSGKFDQKAYGNLGTAGMHGIGIKAVNAASKQFEIEAITQYTYLENGQIQTNHKRKIKYKIIFNQDNIISKEQEEVDNSSNTYAKITAYIDDGLLDENTNQPVFEDLFWNKDEIINLLELNTALVPKGIINFKFIKDGEEYTQIFESKDGLLSYAKNILNDESDDFIHYTSPMFEYNAKLFQYDVVFKANENHGKIYSFANTVPTPRGGSHQEAIQDALALAIQNYAKQTNLTNKTLRKRVILDSLDILIHAQIDNSIVNFEGQTKDILATPLANHAIDNHAKDALLDALYDNEEKANKLIEIIMENEALENAKNKTEKAFKEASKKLSKKDKMKLSSKLKAASSKNPAEKELFIVEGDSASNIGRDLRTQAVFPIRGKIKNVFDLSLSEALKNKEVSTIIATIGAGVGSEFDLDKMNYGKVILACFSGDTKIKCLGGNSYSFEELVNKGQDSIWTYAKDKYGNVVPALGENIRVTGTTKHLLKFTLDNGKSFKSTYEHFLMDAEGQYNMASTYKVGDSLMPIHFRINDNGREEYYDSNAGEYKPTYRMVAENVLKDEMKAAQLRLKNEDHASSQNCIQVHHKDFNKLNNDPANLDWVTSKEHFTEYNPSWALTYNGSEKHIADVKRAHKNGIYDHIYFGNNGYNGSEKHHQTVVAVNKSKKHIDSVKTTNILLGVKFLIVNNLPFDEYHYNFYRHINAPKYRNLIDYDVFHSYKEIYEKAIDFPLRDYTQAYTYTVEYDNNKKQRSQIAKVIKKLLDLGLEFNKENYNKIKGSRTINYDNITKWFDSYDQALEHGKNYNHKIVKIEKLDYAEPVKVYCMTVKKYHNFLLDSENIVKNCDNDSDGHHIRALLVTLFSKFFPEIISSGRLYTVDSPLYKIITYKDGEPNIQMVYSETEKANMEIPKDADIERYKGLGEMSVEEAHIALANPKTRRLIQLSSDDAEEIQNTLDILLGTKNEERRKWAKSLKFV